MSTEQEEKTENSGGVVQTALTSIQDFKGTPKSKKKGWIFGLIAAILSIVAVAVVYYQLWRRGKEVAKLKHERDLLREKEQQHVVDSQIATNTMLRIEAMQAAQRAQEEQAVITEQIDSLREEAVEQRSIIDSLTTWEDVDKYIR